MDIVKICGAGIVAAILSIVLRKDHPMFSALIALSASALIITMLLPELAGIIELLKRASESVSVGVPFISALLKIIGISYISEFGAQICFDAGETAIASKIEFGGKILILAVSAPIMMSLLDLVVNLIP